jgi:hypothetical protein
MLLKALFKNYSNDTEKNDTEKLETSSLSFKEEVLPPNSRNNN